jgi:predicted transcriptional regulator
MGRILSIGRISKELGAEPHRVRYAIESRHIKSVGKAGNTHCYGDDELAQIKAALEEIGSKGDETAEQPAREAGAVPAGA